MAQLKRHAAWSTRRTHLTHSETSGALDRVGKWNRALDLTVEAVIVTETKWRELFEPEVIEAARQRLLDHEWTEETGRDN